MSEQIKEITYEDEMANKFLETKVNIVNNVFELGRILCEVKEQLGHGNFTKWIKDSRVNMKPTQCRTYMRIYKTFENNGSAVVLSDLSIRNLDELCQLSQEVREEMIESSETSKDLIKRLKCYKKEQKVQKDLQKEKEVVEEEIIVEEVVEEREEEQEQIDSNRPFDDIFEDINKSIKAIKELRHNKEYQCFDEQSKEGFKNYLHKVKELIDEFENEIIMIEPLSYEVEKTPEEIERIKEIDKLYGHRRGEGRW